MFEAVQRTWVAWALLGAAMCVSAAWLLSAGADTTFAGDGLYYYARLVIDWPDIAPAYGLEFVFAPNNGHFQAGGKLIYLGLFELVGADYFAFRAVNVAGVLLCVGLFFELARHRVGPVLALIPAVLLLFLGFGWEVLLWAFDMHTVYSLAFGLAALLALERGRDIAACALLVLSVAMIELGLAFVAGAAVSVLLSRDRAQRAWVFLVPLVLYASWWAWAQQYDQPGEFTLSNVSDIPATLTGALATVLGSLTGVNPTGSEVSPQLTEVTEWSAVFGGLAAIGLAIRLSRGSVPPLLWVMLTVIGAYWTMIALGDRPPGSSRYVFAGSLLFLLAAACALHGYRLSRPVAAVVLVVAALAIPPNLAKFYDGRRYQVDEAELNRVEYAMLELARDTVSGGYAPGLDPRVQAAGGAVLTPLYAGDYLRAAREHGSIALPLPEVVRSEPKLRRVADAALAGGLALELVPSPPPPDGGSCVAFAGSSRGRPVRFPLPAGRELTLRSRAGRSVGFGVRRFANAGQAVPLGSLAPGEWRLLKIPPDPGPGSWIALADGSVEACGRRLR